MSSSTMSNYTFTLDLQTILKKLPACQRCRKNKKRCDLLLPACSNCTRAEEECVFIDHITNERLPRKYIASLVGHIRDLKAETSTNALEGADGVALGHFVPARNTMRYLGGRAPLAVHAEVQELNTDWQTTVNFSNGWSISPEMHTFMIERYFQIIHKTYPVFDWPSDFLRSTLPTDGSNDFLCYIRAMVYSIACHAIASPEMTPASLSFLANYTGRQ
ncbi:hypothetical protein PV05_10186 [Exophiala xenobiotica]|uniref:Zn(2)-C6 fungal-type domain-containing protein n=1 Tax=Exophiala xenobiotica TaxID=348802 RepID=A0A0D2BH03_9EURO|nr:uncharacterized protein PV05_10186 [Exophiala xenobiotica]KIW51471.1 hypothetical protein PV05_10186 [Exophiala xenobiotica]